MDANNWRLAAPRGEASVEQVDWRAQLLADSRLRIVDKILETLKRRLPYSGPVGLQGLKEIAEHFEARIYAAASSQTDYLRKISLKMLTMENKSQNTIPNIVPANANSSSNRLSDTTASHSLPSQVQNQPQAHQQLVSQNNRAPGGLQSSTGLNSLPSVSGTTQSSMTNVVVLDGNMHNEQGISQASASLDTSAQSGQVNGGDWQEEAYQKVKQMREKYMPELTEMYQKISAKLQQHDSMPQQPKSDHDKLKMFKQMVERLLHVLQTPKSNISPGFKEKLVIYEKQIQSFSSSYRTRQPVQQGLAQPHMQNLQQQQSQVSQVQSHENHHMNPQMQSMTLQGSTPTIPLNSMSSLQHNSLPSISGISASQENMMDPFQTSSNADSGQGNSLGFLQQVAVGSLQQNSVSSFQQPSISSLSTQSGVSMLQPNIPMQSNSNMLCQQRQHLLKRKFQPENVPQPHMQCHIPHHQQIILQPNPLQSSQQLMQNSGVVQQSLIQSSMLQRHQQQSVGMQQQAALIHHQQSQKTKQQRLMGEQVNVANMQQNQLMGLQNSTSGMQQRLQLNDLQNLQQRQFQLQQQLQQQQQQLIAHQNNLPNMHQQKLDAQNIVVSQQQQLLRSQSGNSGLQTNQHSVHMLQQPMVPIQQQPQPGGTGLLASQGQQPQLQAAQEQLMPQMQSSDTQLQQRQLGLQQQTNSMQREQQRLQGPAQVTGSLDPAAQSSQVNGGDWQEEGYQKVLQMTEKYLRELTEVLLQVAAKLREVASQQPKSDQLVKLENDRQAAQRFLNVLQTPKTRLTPDFKERLAIFEKQIESFLATFGQREPTPKEPLPSPSEPTLSCPICFGPFDRETTTKCGHMFCEKCIKAALAKRKRCPTCRRKVVARDLIRVYLGTNTSIPCFD